MIPQVRLDVYLNKEEWIISIQTVGVSEDSPSTWLYVYSNALPEYFTFIADDEIIGLEDKEIFNDQGEFQINLFHDNILIQGRKYTYDLTNENYVRKGIVLKNRDSYLTYFMRMLSEINETKEMLLWGEENLKRSLNLGDKWNLFYRTTEWEHTEVEEEKPSKNIFFNSLAKAIEKRDTSIIQLGNINTHWKNWIDYDFENQHEWID